MREYLFAHQKAHHIHRHSQKPPHLRFKQKCLFGKENVKNTSNKVMLKSFKIFIFILRELPKRAVKFMSTKDEATLFIADKTGDVYTIDLNDANWEPKLLMGHLSTLLDTVILLE